MDSRASGSKHPAGCGHVSMTDGNAPPEPGSPVYRAIKEAATFRIAANHFAALNGLFPLAASKARTPSTTPGSCSAIARTSASCLALNTISPPESSRLCADNHPASAKAATIGSGTHNSRKHSVTLLVSKAVLTDIARSRDESSLAGYFCLNRIWLSVFSLVDILWWCARGDSNTRPSGS